MKTRMLWKVALRTTPEAEEAVTELLQSILGTVPSSYTDIDSGVLRVSAYVDFNPGRKRSIRAQLNEGINRIRRSGLPVGPGRLCLAPVRRENWAESWKRHFKPFEIGTALLVKPGWSHRRPKKGQAVVVLDPGLSFGTGHHPTTSFCLQQLTAARTLDRTQSFLDIGTGSGILAIAAAKLGYSPVHAFDFDLESVKVSKANASANGVRRAIRITRSDVTRLPLRGRPRYSAVCANLVAPLLLSQSRRIRASLEPGGLLVLAGILRAEFAEVRKAYETIGLRMVSSRVGKEWHSGSFRSANN